MNIRKVAANYIIPVSRFPIKNGILHFNETGEILKIIDPEDDFHEESKLEFYNGILVPGFITCFKKILNNELNRQLSKENIIIRGQLKKKNYIPANKLFEIMVRDGILLTGIISQQNISETNNNVTPWRLIPGDSDINSISSQDQYLSDVILFESNINKPEKDVPLIKSLIKSTRENPEMPLEQIIKWATLNGAIATSTDKWAGSLDVGKRPGLNLINNVNFEKFKLTGKSTLKALL